MEFEYSELLAFEGVVEFDEINFDLIDAARIVEGLGAREIAIIKLRYFNDLSYAKIGEVIGVSATRIREILLKSLRKLRRS